MYATFARSVAITHKTAPARPSPHFVHVELCFFFRRPNSTASVPRRPPSTPLPPPTLPRGPSSRQASPSHSSLSTYTHDPDSRATPASMGAHYAPAPASTPTSAPAPAPASAPARVYGPRARSPVSSSSRAPTTPTMSPPLRYSAGSGHTTVINTSNGSHRAALPRPPTPATNATWEELIWLAASSAVQNAQAGGRTGGGRAPDERSECTEVDDKAERRMTRAQEYQRRQRFVLPLLVTSDPHTHWPSCTGYPNTDEEGHWHPFCTPLAVSAHARSGAVAQR